MPYILQPRSSLLRRPISWSMGFLGERPLHNFGGCDTIGSRVSLFGVGLSTFQFRLGRMNAVVAEPGTLARGGFFLGLSRRVRARCQCRSAVAGVRKSSSAGDARPQFSPISCPAASAHRIEALIAAALVGPMSGIYATQVQQLKLWSTGWLLRPCFPSVSDTG